MFQSINLNQIDIEHLPKYQHTNLRKYKNQLLKIIPEKDRKKIMKIHHFFLLHPMDFCFTPEKVLFSDDLYSGYTMTIHPEYQPLNQYKEHLSITEKWQIIDQIYNYLTIMNDYFIYTDIDEHNILYDGQQLKIIDFDDIYIKDQQANEKEQSLLQYQQTIFNLFATSFLYNVSIYDIYYLKDTDKLTNEQKQKITTLLNHPGYLTSSSIKATKKTI